MALLRLLCFPSPTHHLFSSAPSLHLNSNLSPPSRSFSTTSSSLSRLPVAITLKAPNPSLNLFLLSCSINGNSTTETLTIEKSETKEEEKEEEVVVDEASRTRLLAQNIPWTSTPDDLRPLFEKFGTVVDIELAMFNKVRNRGLAFVTMGSHDEAVAAMNGLEAQEFEGRVLSLRWANPRRKRASPPPRPASAPVHNLFVANLHFRAKAKDLKEFFIANNGNAVSAEVKFNTDNPPRSAGYGFVSFNTRKEAEEALTAFQGKEFMGRPLRVAPSKTFLRQETAASIQSENGKSELKPDVSNESEPVKVEA